jgi:hypothetical protein
MCPAISWFWSGKSGTYNNSKEWGEQIAVLKHCEATTGKFQHKSSAHTARHFFAITMLTAGTDIELVAKWLGHSSSKITSKHYFGANNDWHNNSHAEYMKAMEAIEGAPAKRRLFGWYGRPHKYRRRSSLEQKTRWPQGFRVFCFK